MKDDEKRRALIELARLHPTGSVDHIYGFGVWKNPYKPNSICIIWTQRDLKLFREFQAANRQGCLCFL